MRELLREIIIDIELLYKLMADMYALLILPSLTKVRHMHRARNL